MISRYILKITFDTKSIPDFKLISTNIIAVIVIFDLFFYIIHFSFHKVKILQIFHEKHHQHVMPIVLSTNYTHPIETILVNNGPVFFGMILILKF